MKKIRTGILCGCLALLLSACGTEAAGPGNADEYSVVYSWNNADTDARPRSGRIADDWNGDGAEDILSIEVAEQEGSEIIKKMELRMSGSDAPYVIQDQTYYFIDIIPGNFDADADTEVLLVFDMRFAGGNGTIGIQLLDFDGSAYVNIADGFFDGFFTGYAYSVDVRAGEDGGYLVSRPGGREMGIRKDGIRESAIGMVTGAYFLDVLEKDGLNYIRIKQYVAGEDMTDHVGDVTSIFGGSDGGLTLLEEKMDLLDNTSCTSMWTGVEICYYEDLDSYTGNLPQIFEVENPGDIEELKSIAESMQVEPTDTSRPMGFPRYVVTFRGEDNKSQSFSVDSESVFAADCLANGNYVPSAGIDPYGRISSMFKPNNN